MTKSTATRESILADFDLIRDDDDPDRMISDFDDADLLPETLDYLIDDPHADPEHYMMQSATFRAHNHITADDDYYSRTDLQLSYRMIAEMIAAECDYRTTELMQSHALLLDLIQK